MRNERRVLVVGSGGREQSIAQSLSNSATHVFIAPGNAGTNFLGDNVSNIDLHREDTAEIVDIVRKNDISMVIVGPESWLEKEIGDVLETEKIPAIAPQKDRAILELDKVYTRLKCNEWGVPQPKFAYFSKIEEALGFIRGNNLAEGVVKVSGPAMGKGVTVCNSANELESAIISAKKNFGKAADKILIEERLYGQEVSYIGICDGKTFLPFTPAMDFKFLNGRTTGGMASIAPNPYVTAQMAKNIESKIVKPVIEGMENIGKPYKGVLYFGIMLTKDGPKLIEINARHGDPETQVQLLLLKHNLESIYYSAINGALSKTYGQGGINFSPGEAQAALVVLAAEGYPDASRRGDKIYGLENALPEGTTIYHSGTKIEGENIITNGGRVLGIATIVKKLENMSNENMLKRAIERNYSLIGRENNGIYFEGMQYLKNINNSEIIESEKDFYKTSGVSYDPVDRLKRMASKSARQTENTAKDFGFEAISQSRGESAYLIKMGSYIGAFVEEGLGTKNLIAENEPASYYETIAWDTVACIVNDLIAVGAQPVIICPHWAGGSSEFFKNEERNKSMYTGWLKACEFANAIYGPGETSILNDIVHKNSIVMSGSGFGVIKSPQKPTLGQRLAPGDHIVLIESSGIHANGHSLARKIAKEFLPNGYKEKLPSGRSFGEALLTRTHIYSALQKRLFEEKVDIKYMVNITGHGWRKLMRAKSPFTYRIYNIPTSQEEFKLIQEAAGISDYQMWNTFSMGAGYAIMVPSEFTSQVVEISKECGFKAWDAGIVEKGPKQVIIEPKNIIYTKETLKIR